MKMQAIVCRAGPDTLGRALALEVNAESSRAQRDRCLMAGGNGGLGIQVCRLATRMTDGKGRGRAAFPLVSSHGQTHLTHEGRVGSLGPPATPEARAPWRRRRPPSWQ